MGISLAKLWNVFSPEQEFKVIMVGLDNAGKTTALCNLRLGEVMVHCEPTVGFNVECVQYSGSTFMVWDMGGQDRTRILWRYYYEGVCAVIFVVDSTDRLRLQEARDELQAMLKEKDLANAVLCVLANKSDLPNAMTVSQVSTGLELGSLADRKWYIQSTCAVSGEGLLDAFSWLSARAKEMSAAKR